MPVIEFRAESSADAEDRRMVEEVREMSLRDVGVGGSGSYERATRHRHRESSRDTREDEARRRRREQGRRRRPAEPGTASEDTEQYGRTTESRSQARHIEHQSSLRSLISNSDVDSAEMEAEIMRQITEEGLLDGIDLNDLDVSQEDELSERIADAYRRRHGRTLRPRDTRTGDLRESDSVQTNRDRPRHREQHRSAPVQQVTQSSHPPISRPHLFEAYPTGNGHRRRTSSEHRRRTSPAATTSSARLPADNRSQAARSATDLSERPRTATNARVRPAENTRRTTDPERQVPADNDRRVVSHSRPSSASSATNRNSPANSPRAINFPQQVTTQQFTSTPLVEITTESFGLRGRPRSHQDRQTPYPSYDLNGTGTEPSSVPTMYALSSQLYPEPIVQCDRCGKANIAYDLHYNCTSCKNGDFNLCIRCYRLAKGCLHWFGFGKAAMQQYERQAASGGYSPNHDLPHVLRGTRYLQPLAETRSSSDPQKTTSDPMKRLKTGFCCSNCVAFANECFWKCDRCNEGEWGFCNPCVNQGKCCTHPLLPVAHSSVTSSRNDRALKSKPYSSFAPAASASSSQSDSIPLVFRTACDLCNYFIPPSTNRFHCPQCNNGDYDICKSCYQKLISTNQLSKENGDQGWRRCLKGHRMIILGFDDSPLGQQRMVVRDLVGGHALKDDHQNTASSQSTEQNKLEWRWRDEGAVRTASHTTPSNSPSLGYPISSSSASRYPPSGGVGLAAVALWAYWPEDDASDQLGFPKHAEIREAVDINGDWFWGVYCGRGDFWPGAYARVIR